MSVMLIISFHAVLYLLSFLHGIHFVNASRQLFKNAGIFNGNKCGECGELWPIQQKFKSCKNEKKTFWQNISFSFSVFEAYVSKHNISKRQADDYDYFDYASESTTISSIHEESSTQNQSYYYRIRVKVHVRRRQENETELKSERGHIDDPVVLKTIQMTESFMHFIKQTNALENVPIPWHWYVVGKNHTVACPAQLLNERWLVSIRKCKIDDP